MNAHSFIMISKNILYFVFILYNCTAKLCHSMFMKGHPCFYNHDYLLLLTFHELHKSWFVPSANYDLTVAPLSVHAVCCELSSFHLILDSGNRGNIVGQEYRRRTEARANTMDTTGSCPWYFLQVLYRGEHSSRKPFFFYNVPGLQSKLSPNFCALISCFLD